MSTADREGQEGEGFHRVLDHQATTPEQRLSVVLERAGNAREVGAILRELEAARQELARVEDGVRAGMVAR